MKSKNLEMSDIARKTFFQRLQTFKTDYSPCTISQYESQRTGMRAVVVDRKGPKVRGFFTLATEIHDDSGARKYLSSCPSGGCSLSLAHTLEHLVFMVSIAMKFSTT
jgi:Zn-dependent M16 (insulinase) family peptidase